MSKKLVFVHGRSQQDKDAGALKAEWIRAWEAGLAKSGLALPVAESDIRFPYYGDTLAQLVAGADASEAAQVIVRGASSAAANEFVREVLLEVMKREGISPSDVEEAIPQEVLERGVQNWGWVQGILKVIDRKVPFASGASLALFTKDVFDYLNKPALRQVIDAGVVSAFRPEEETVVVSHSLGTVVAYNVLRSSQAETWMCHCSLPSDRHWPSPESRPHSRPSSIPRARTDGSTPSMNAMLSRCIRWTPNTLVSLHLSPTNRTFKTALKTGMGLVATSTTAR